MRTPLAVAALTLALVAPAPPAVAVPTLSVTSTVDADYPQQVPAATGPPVAGVSYHHGVHTPKV